MKMMEAFILTGGRSMRMGREKATLELNGIPLAERAADIARSASVFSRIRFVGGHSTNENFVADIYNSRGPLGGLHAALDAADAEWVLLLGCDLPFITHELITRLAAYCADDVDAIIPRQDDGHLQPLCAFYRVAACLPVASELLSEAVGAGLRDLLDKLRSREVQFGEIRDLRGAEHFFLNVNTPDQLETARRIAVATAPVAK